MNSKLKAIEVEQNLISLSWFQPCIATMVYSLLYVWVTNTQKRYKIKIYQNNYTYKEKLSAVDLKKNVISQGLYKDLGLHD